MAALFALTKQLLQGVGVKVGTHHHQKITSDSLELQANIL